MPSGLNTNSAKRLLGLLTALISVFVTVALSSAVTFTYASINAGTGNPTNVLGNNSLGAPTLAAPTVSGAGATATVGLSWTLPSGDPANQSVILRGASACPPGSFSTVTTVGTTSYTDTPGAAGYYCYEIEGKLGNWTSQASNQRTVTVYELPVLIQKAHREATAATSVSATFSADPVANHLLVAIVGGMGSTVINLPSGWSSAINESGTPSQAIFYKISAGSADKSVTVTTGTATDLDLRLLEYSGIKTVSPLDQTGSATGYDGSPSSGSVTTAQSVELLVVGSTSDGNAYTTGWSNSFTLELDTHGHGNDKYDCSAADNIVYATGTYSSNPTVAGGQPGNWRGQIASFKAGPN